VISIATANIPSFTGAREELVVVMEREKSMESRFGVRGTVYDGVFFTEAQIPGAKVIRHLHLEISLQNANLSQVNNAWPRKPAIATGPR
jgi:hypothetical protein